MKICYVTLGFAPAFELGGPVQNSYQLLRRLVKRGVEVTVCCTNLSGKSTKSFAGTRRSFIEGIEVIYFDTYKLFPLGIGSFGAYYAPGMKTFCRERLDDYSLIHMDGYRVVPNMLFSMYARKKRIPYVIQARGTLPADFNSIAAKKVFDVVFGRKILGNAACLIASSETEKRQYLGLMPSSEPLVRVIGCGVDVEEYSEIPDGNSFRSRWDPERKGRKIVSYVGRIHALKGIDHLIRACARSAYRSDLLLLIAGPDEGEVRRLRVLADREGLCEQIRFIGRIDNHEKRQMYAGSDVVVYASKSESFGMVAFEAVLCGAPLIVSRDTGCGDLMNHYSAALLVDYGDVQALTRGIDGILDEPARHQTKSLNARDRIIAEMGCDRIAGLYHDVYSEVAENGRKSGA